MILLISIRYVAELLQSFCPTFLKNVVPLFGCIVILDLQWSIQGFSLNLDCLTLSVCCINLIPYIYEVFSSMFNNFEFIEIQMEKNNIVHAIRYTEIAVVKLGLVTCTSGIELR